MDVLFRYVTTNMKSTHVNKNSTNTSKTNSNQPAQTFLLDPHKLQNIDTVLRSLALNYQEILDALLNGSDLNPNTLKKLTKVAPTKEEETMILEYSGNPSKLTDAEYFLYHLLRTVPSPFLRLDAMLFRSTFESEILQLMELLQTIESACKELRPRKLFLKLVGATIRASNRMKTGSARGNAQQFNLSTLNKLSNLRIADGKTTLLHLVVEEVVRSEGKRCAINHDCSLGQRNGISSPREDREKRYMILGLPVVGGLSVEFTDVKKAAMIDYDSFISVQAVLTAHLNRIRQFLGGQHLGGGDGFVREMEGFLDKAEEELGVLKEKELRVLELVRSTTEYYQVGAHIDREAHPLQIFIIVKDFLGIVDQVCIDIARSQQQKRKPESPPKRTTVRFQNLEAHFIPESSQTSSAYSYNSSDFEDGF